MSGKRWIFLWLPLSLLAAERDPFQHGAAFAMALWRGGWG